MRKSGAATDGQAFLAKKIHTGMGRTKPESNYFNLVQQAEKTMLLANAPQNLRISTQLLVILLSNLLVHTKKGIILANTQCVSA